MDWRRAPRIKKDEVPTGSTLVNVTENPDQPNGAIGVVTETFRPCEEHGGTIRGYFWVVPPAGYTPTYPEKLGDNSGLVQIVSGPEGHLVDPKLHTHWNGQW